MIRWNFKWLISAAAVLGLLGCDGCYQAQDERQLVLSFVKPQAGGQVGDADDADRTRDGLQYDVEVKLEWESLTDGSRTPADISEAGLAVARLGDRFPDATQGTVGPGGAATFSGVSFTENGDYQLRATARELASQQVTDPVTILVSVQSVPNRPAVLTSKVVQDTNGDLKLSGAELPVGEIIKIDFTTVNLSNGTANAVLTTTGQTVGTTQVTNDQGTVSLNQLPATAFEGQYTVRLELLNTASNIPSAPTNAAPDTLTITVDQVGPTVRITEPRPDAGYGSRTVSANATVAGALGATVAFVAVHVDGGTMDAGSALVDATGTATTTVSLFEGRQDLNARVVDAVGNPGSDSVAVFVNTVACNVTISDPSNGAYLGPSQDAAPADGGFEYVVVGTAPDCPGRAAQLTVGTAQFSGTTDATGAFAVQVQLQPGANKIQASVDNGAGVPGLAEADVFVGTSDFRIVAPANNAVLSRTSDINAAQAKIQSPLNWTGTTTGTATVTVCSNLPAASGTTPCPDGSTWIVFAANTPPTAVATYDDGVYQLKAVMLDGTNVIATSPAVAIRVDNARPLVSPTGIRLQNDANADLDLNASEQSSGSATAVITVSGMEDGTTVTVRSTANNAVLGTGTVMGNMATVALASVSGPEANYDVVVGLVDAAGNANQTGAGSTADPRNDDAFATLRVDRVAPSCGLTQPTKSNLGLPDDGSAAAGFQLHLECVGPADLTAVAFSANTLTATGSLSGSTAAADITVNATGTTVYNLSATPTDASGNVGTASTRQVTADFDKPLVTINQPNQAGSPYVQYTLATNVSVAGEASGTVRVYTTVGTAAEQLLGTLTISGGTASGNITYPNGNQTVRAEVTDAAGNVGEDTETITVASPGCSIALSAPAPGKQYFNQADDLDKTSTPAVLEYAVTGTSTNCPSRPVAIYRGTGASRVLLTSGTTGAAGAFSLQISLAEGPQHIEVEITDAGNVANFIGHDATVDLSLPTLSSVTPAQTTVTYVAITNVNTRGAGTAGYINDSDSAVDGAQISLSFTASGANGGKAYVFYQGVQKGTALDITSDSAPLTAAVTLEQATTGALELRVADAAGNTVVHAKTATVDVVAPAAPAYTALASNLRTGVISLSWPAVFDDGSTATSGAVSGYDLRWSNAVHLSSGVLTEDDFFNLPNQTPPKLKIETGALLPPTTTSYSLTVPPLMSSFVVLRAVDEVGNYSGFVPSTSVNGSWTQATLNNPGTNTLFAQTLAAKGNFNNDSFNDFAVGAPGGTQPGGVYVYFGASDPATITAQPVTTPDGSAGAQSFGWIVDMGNLSSSLNADLVVGAPLFNNVGRAYLYFGKAGTTFDSSSTNAVIFEGVTGETIGRGLSIIEDISGDGLSELLLSSHSANSNRGRIFIFFGRSKASWEMLRSGGVIRMTSADRIIEGPLPMGAGSFGNSFGWFSSSDGIGNVNGDGRPDFAVAASMDNVNKLFVFSGQTVFSKTAATGVPTLTTGDAPTTPDESMQRLVGTDPGDGTSRDGFGSRIAGGLHIIGSTDFDLVAGHRLRSRLHIYSGSSTGQFSTTAMTLSGPLFFGTSLALADLNEDGRVDLVTSDGVTSASSIWLFFNKGVAGQELDGTAGNGFMHSQLKSTSALGRSLAISDINNDNKLDIVAGDTSGKVQLWH